MDLGDWLRSLGLERYETAFRENEIDETVLRGLTAEDLKEMGVVPIGHRRKLLDAIAILSADTSGERSSHAARPVSEQPKDGAERRQLTVMFCDLVGSTALAASMDPEDLREVISAYQKCAAETVRRFDGFVAKYMGDRVLVYFGYPQAHEDDAERAVRAGLELISALAGLKTRASLQTRVGIATGLVIVGDLIGSGEAQERGIVGETPNLAARLQGLAQPNTVVIAEDTRRLLGNLFELTDLGAKDLKGIAGSVAAWSVLRPSSIESRFEALHATGLTTLVGRDEEMDLLLRRWSKAKTGEGQVVLLSGEAGIGKSRLTAALLERLANEPHTRLRYFCSPQHTDSAFHPIINQMGRAVGLEHDDPTTAKLDKLDALLAQTSTSKQDAALLAELLTLPNDGRYPALDLAPEQRRQKTSGRSRFAVRSPDAIRSSADDLRGCALGRPYEPGSVQSGREPDRDASRVADRDVSAGVRAALGWAALRDSSQPQSTAAARSWGDDRHRHRQQVASSERQARPHRAYRWHPPVRGGDDEGTAGNRKRGPGEPDRRCRSSTGGPCEPARLANGKARPPGHCQGGGANRIRNRPRVFASHLGCCGA